MRQPAAPQPPGRAEAGAATLGLLFALWVYGWRVLNPASAAWLMHGDPAQHYLGSVFFLADRWHWPPGLIEGFGRTPTSVVFTDAIPLLALPAKLLGWPAGLQYFGAWMLLCHALTAWAGVRLLRRLDVQDTLSLLTGALLFTMAPALLLRAYGHEALMAHFLVVGALVLALTPWRWRGWLLLAALATLVHAYLALMVCVIGCARALAAWRIGEVRPTALLGQGGCAAVTLFALAWLAGYFVGSGQISAAGHGYYSANLLTWFDPMDWKHFMRMDAQLAAQAREWSRWLPAQEQSTTGQYEGFAYLGAGVLLATLLALGGALAPLRMRGQLTESWAGPRALWLALLAAVALLALLAASARPGLGGRTLMELPLGETTQHWLGVFRASGRFVWPATYLAMGVALAWVARLPAGRWLLLLCLLVQVADLHGKFKEFRQRFRTGPPGIEQPLAAPQWPGLLARCGAIEMLSDAHPPTRWVAPALAAGLAQARFHPAPTARHSPQEAQEQHANTLRLLRDHRWRSDTLYLLAPPLPGGYAAADVLAGLPVTMQAMALDGRTLVVPRACAER